MAPVSRGAYSFDPQSITKVRNRLELTQKQMAEKLGVPVNTLSRWETGATTPDANSLAAIYSLALDQGYTPGFFRKTPAPKATAAKPGQEYSATSGIRRVVVMLDLQNIAVKADRVSEMHSWIEKQIQSRFPSATPPLLKAFASSNQQKAVEGLKILGWRVKISGQGKAIGLSNWDEAIIQESRADCGKDAAHTALLLVTQDGDFADLAKQLNKKGVSVYVLGRENTSQKLVQAVGEENWIKGLPI